MAKVAINGLGRIGRAALKILLDADATPPPARRSSSFPRRRRPEMFRLWCTANRPDGQPQIVSCASCTTNCIPVIEIAHRRVGVERAIMTTVHAYITGQNLIDAPSREFRRGRSGAANLVPTSTGAARDTTRAHELVDKFHSIAVRAPIPSDRSPTSCSTPAGRPLLKRSTTCSARKRTPTDTKGFSGSPRTLCCLPTSSRISRASIVDLALTRVVDSTIVKVMAWYDNEWGFTNR